MTQTLRRPTTPRHKPTRAEAEDIIRHELTTDVSVTAVALSRGETAIRAAVASGELPSIRLGRTIRIPTAPLRDLLGID